MPRKKKATFTPKKKKTLVPEPNWDKLQKSKTEESKTQAFYDALDFVHYEVPEKEQLHWLKKWIREVSDWDLHEETKTLPDVYMHSFAKYGWIAIKLGFMPKTVESSLVKNLKPLLERCVDIRQQYATEEVELPKEKDHFLNPEKVKKWLSVWKDYLKGIDKYQDSSDSKQRMQYQVAQTYIYNMNSYLRTGVWSDTHFGENREGKVVWVCKSPAYNKDGTMKRTVGHWYPDIGQIWTKELENEIR